MSHRRVLLYVGQLRSHSVQKAIPWRGRRYIVTTWEVGTWLLSNKRVQSCLIMRIISYILIQNDTHIYIKIQHDTHKYKTIHTEKVQNDTHRYIMIHTDTYRYKTIHTDTK